MDVVVFGNHAEVDPELRALTTEKCERVTKFANDVRRIDVDFGEAQTRRAGDSHTCEILVHVNHHLVKGTAAASEHAIALDKALAKVEHQMRRLHERRVDRRNGSRARAGADSARAEDNGAAPEPEATDENAGPLIVKTKQFEVKPMTAEEAALQMELLDHDFFLFRLSDTGRAAVIYRRKDGALGVIEVTG
jgi:putative sigma-54 modulation protein